MPMKVVFSPRAYTTLLCELIDNPCTETGGIFIGYRYADKWYIVETIHPGPDAIMEPAYFEYCQKYANYQANKLASLYEAIPEILGLWHKHPGSFDRFSSVDDVTNARFADTCKQGIISALVNIDPHFRIRVFSVSLPLSYQEIEYDVDQSDTLNVQMRSVDNLIATIEEQQPKHYVEARHNHMASFIDKLSKYCEDNNCPPIEMSDVDNKDHCDSLAFLFQSMESDLDCLTQLDIAYSLELIGTNELKLSIRQANSEDFYETLLFVCTNQSIWLKWKQNTIEYQSELLQRINNISL